MGSTGRPRPPGPDIPADIEVRDLDREVRAELRALPKGAADTVARHLVAAGRFLDTDPALALAHAQAARLQAARIASVREAVGIAAYHAGEWKLAIGELRAWRRLTGSDAHLAVIADSERALGRPEKAIELAASPEAARLDTETRVELMIVAAGARQDQGDLEGALATLDVPELRTQRASDWLARLRYAYAELLLAAGQVDTAREWFVQAADADVDGATDADERVLDLDGFLFTEEGTEHDDADDERDLVEPFDEDESDDADDDAQDDDAQDDAAQDDDGPSDRDDAPSAQDGGGSAQDDFADERDDAYEVDAREGDLGAEGLLDREVSGDDDWDDDEDVADRPTDEQIAARGDEPAGRDDQPGRDDQDGRDHQGGRDDEGRRGGVAGLVVGSDGALVDESGSVGEGGDGRTGSAGTASGEPSSPAVVRGVASEENEQDHDGGGRTAG